MDGGHRIDVVARMQPGERCRAGAKTKPYDPNTDASRGEMRTWSSFYGRLFGFEEQKYFDIKGQKTGLTSRALTSPCGKIRIPINEPSDNKSQIQEYLDAYHGEGIQHIALASDDIHNLLSRSIGAHVELAVLGGHAGAWYGDAVAAAGIPLLKPIEQDENGNIVKLGSLFSKGKPVVLGFNISADQARANAWKFVSVAAQEVLANV